MNRSALGGAAAVTRWLTFAAILAACSSTSPGRLARQQKELQLNEKRWQQSAVQDYSFIQQRICNCLPEVTRPARIVVSAGSVVSISNAETGAPADSSNGPSFLTVTGLFDFIRSAIDQDAAAVSVVYDPLKGYPANVVIDYQSGVADEELAYIVSTFVPAPARSRVALDSSFELKLGETVEVGDSGPRLTFRDVLEESRCPEDVVCVWAGNARIQLGVTTGSGSALLELNTPQQPSVARHAGYEISLLSLSGPGKAGASRSSTDYVATLRVAEK